MTSRNGTGRKRVTVAILRCGDRFAFQLRDDRTATYPRYWSLFGGRIEPQETPTESVLREVSEELGIRLPGIRTEEVLQEAACELNEWHEAEVHVFSADIESLWERRKLGEGESCALLGWEELLRLEANVTPMTIKIMRRYLSREETPAGNETAVGEP